MDGLEDKALEDMSEEELRMVGACKACMGCGKAGFLDSATNFLCRACCLIYPPSLAKANYDEFVYALKLRTGEVIFFAHCDILGDYVTLYGGDQGFAHTEHDLNDYTVEMGSTYGADLRPTGTPLPPPFPDKCFGARGVDVRVRDIVWCMDAPFGS